MKRPSIHQILVSAAEGDAVTRMALNLRDELRGHCDSEVYAYWRHGDAMEKECLSLDDLPQSEDVSVLVYHLSIGWKPVSELIHSRTERLVIAYHNVTPSHFYEEHQPEFAADLRLGRSDLLQLADRAVLALADSKFNAMELEAAGFRDTRVVPAGLKVDRLVRLETIPSIVQDTGRRFPEGYVVAVGQVLPHKRIEQLLQTMHLLNTTRWGNVGLVVCGVARQVGYLEALHRFRAVTPMANVHFTGPVSDRALATYVRGARAFLGMSDHEGYCIPPLEAAAVGVPVVIKGAAAVPETVQGAGIVLPEGAGPCEASEALAMVLDEDEVRWRLIDAGYSRIADIDANDDVRESARILIEVAK